MHIKTHSACIVFLSPVKELAFTIIVKFNMHDIHTFLLYLFVFEYSRQGVEF